MQKRKVKTQVEVTYRASSLIAPVLMDPVFLFFSLHLSLSTPMLTPSPLFLTLFFFVLLCLILDELCRRIRRVLHGQLCCLLVSGCRCLAFIPAFGLLL